MILYTNLNKFKFELNIMSLIWIQVGQELGSSQSKWDLNMI